MNKLEAWSIRNRLRFSTAKTEAIHFCRRRQCYANTSLRLYSQPIPLKQSVRFLGLEVDNRLTYKEHFKTLRKRCFKTLNILKCVSRTSYGADRRTLMLFYRSLIRSKLDYGCFIYDSASTSAKRTLDTIHHTALRIVTGAFRTSPVMSILADADEPPLSIRRKMLGMRYACKLRQFPAHPTYNSVFSHRITALFRAGERSVPFGVRIRSLFDESGIKLRKVRKLAHIRSAPWDLVTAETDISLTTARKSDFTPAELLGRALERIRTYEGHLLYYTDGSKTETGVGCAFVQGNITRSFTLPSFATVYTAELLAIYKALCFIEVCDDELNVILTDSLSSVLSLKGFYPSHPIVQDILVLLTSLKRAGKTVVFCWIPAHAGIRGNECADAAAKRAAEGPCTRSLPLPSRDFFQAISAFTHSLWQHTWDSLENNKLKALKSNLAPWRSCFRKSRLEEVALCRLRLGHTYATHRYLLCREDRPRCPRCAGPLSVRHVLVMCPHYEPERRRHFGQPSVSLPDLLGENSCLGTEVLPYLADIKFAVIYSSK